MNSREIEINEFLKYFARLYEQNHNLPIESDTIYSHLANYGLTQEEINDKDIRFNFDKWIEFFRNKSNINVFHTDMQTRFLQFRNAKNLSAKCVKLYVSLPKDKIFGGVNKIFSFVAGNNMSTHSKVADRIRSDSIVIRLNEAADALKVIDYINNDNELSYSCKKTNPFLFRQGNVGIAYDDMLSYNSTVALMLEQYFKECRKKRAFNKVSLEHFRDFSNRFYNTIFKNRDKLIDFLEWPDVRNDLHRFYRNKGAMIVNYEQVMRLILESLNPKMKLEQYLSFYKRCLNDENTQEMINYYNDLLTNSYGSKNGSFLQRLFPQKLKLPNEQPIFPTNDDVELLNSYIEFAAQKYGEENVADYLLRYKDNPLAITRTNNFRNRFIANLPYDMILQITNNDIVGYVQKHLKAKGIAKLSATNDKEDYNLFIEACIATYNKYGNSQLIDAISNAAFGDYGYFTNENYRRAMRQRNLAPQINNFCNLIIQQYGVTANSNNLYDMCADSIMNLAEHKRKEQHQENSTNPNTENYNLFIEACVATYNKYGNGQLVAAISNAAFGDYGYFTNENYRRAMRRNNLAPQINTFCKLLIQESSIVATDDLYENCAQAIVSMIELKNQGLQGKIF